MEFHIPVHLIPPVLCLPPLGRVFLVHFLAETEDVGIQLPRLGKSRQHFCLYSLAKGLFQVGKPLRCHQILHRRLFRQACFGLNLDVHGDLAVLKHRRSLTLGRHDFESGSSLSLRTAHDNQAALHLPQDPEKPPRLPAIQHSHHTGLFEHRQIGYVELLAFGAGQNCHQGGDRRKGLAHEAVGKVQQVYFQVFRCEAVAVDEFRQTHGGQFFRGRFHPEDVTGLALGDENKRSGTEFAGTQKEVDMLLDAVGGQFAAENKHFGMRHEQPASCLMDRITHGAEHRLSRAVHIPECVASAFAAPGSSALRPAY